MLKKILEEIIEQLKAEGCIRDDDAGNRAEDIIRKHISATCTNAGSTSCTWEEKNEEGYQLVHYDGIYSVYDQSGACIAEFMRDDNNGWIPVEERMPENDTRVLVQWEKTYRYENIIKTYVDIMWLDCIDGAWKNIQGIVNGEVIAWQPLPEPYRPEKGKAI